MNISIGKSNEIESFWQLMGSFFASRSLVRERGDFLYDEENTIWFIVHDEKKVLGFCTLRVFPSKCLLGTNYVVSEYRNQGVFLELEKVRRDLIESDFARYVQETVVRKVHLKAAEEKGFLVVSRRGSWYVLRKEPVAKKGLI